MDFVVDKHDLTRVQTIPSPPLEVRQGDILIQIIKFAFTANNVSYAATGESLGYWKFFPISQEQDKGRIPVWGVGVIVASRCTGLSGLRRVYGYFPMSQYVVMHPVQLTNADFVDGMPYRRNLPAVYNQYLLCDEDPFYSPRTEEAMMVLRPLYFTSWLLLDFFCHSSSQVKGVPFYGADTIILSSASSKTSIGLAFLLYRYKQDNDNVNIRIVGLTSSRNVPMVESLQIYDDIIVYDQLESQLQSTNPSCFVDMAGNTQVTTRLHQHLGDNMRYSCLVGAAHVGQGGKPTQQLPGARPKFFFAPSWTAQRIQEMSRGGDKRRGLKVIIKLIFVASVAPSLTLIFA